MMYPATLATVVVAALSSHSSSHLRVLALREGLILPPSLLRGLDGGDNGGELPLFGKQALLGPLPHEELPI